MAVMRPCPHCGADNSVKRRVCYECERPLRADTAIARAPAPKPSARRSAGAGADALRGGIFWTRSAAQFFRSWANLIQSGMTVGYSLRHLERHAAPAYRAVAGDMADEIEAGRSVAAAMESHRGLFLKWQVAMVRASEAAGALDRVVGQIATDLDGEYRMRLDLLLKTWHFWVCTIPGILLVLPVALTFLGPEPAGGWTLAALLQRISFYFLVATLPLCAGIAGVIVALRLTGRSARWQEARQRFNLRLPLIGRMLRRAALSRFFGSLSFLSSAGVPLGSAAEIAADASGNEAMAARLRPASEWLRSGGTFTEAIEQSGEAGDDDMRLLAAGEQAGEVPDALQRVADHYRQETEHDRRIYPRVIQLVGYAILVPIAVGLYYVLARTYLTYTLFKPLEAIDEVWR